MRSRLYEAARGDCDPTAVFMREPEETSTFLTTRGLPSFDKGALDSGSPEALATWVASTVRGLARLSANDMNAMLSYVFWSFPQTHDRDFSYLNEAVNRLTGHLLLGQIHILPEHDCLRRRFGSVLTHLATLAQRRRSEREQIIASNDGKRADFERATADYRTAKADYERRWISRLWTRKPIHPDANAYHEQPVPTLEEWHQQFLDLQADPALQEVLIVDAGGYSLDVFLRVGHDSEIQVFSQSFAAGGAQMTTGVRSFLAAQRGCAPEDVSWDEAERRKCEACLGEGMDLSHRCRELTEEIYQRTLAQLAAWGKPYVAARAIPIILTGGGMANPHLRALLQAEFARQGIASAYTNSAELFSILKQLSPAEQAGHPLFCALSCGFSPRTQPRLNYDIIGGLAQAAVEFEPAS